MCSKSSGKKKLYWLAMCGYIYLRVGIGGGGQGHASM